MPGLDGQGPLGQGPLTGRGLGPCGRGMAFRRGARSGFVRGLGRGFGAGYGRYQSAPIAPATPISYAPAKEQEMEALKAEKELLERDLEDLKERIKELERNK